MRRRLLCWMGWHRWQYLMAPPSFRFGDDYTIGIWCIFCGALSPHRPGSVGRE